MTEPLGLAYQRFPPNPVAAVPSLHAAMPLTITLMLWRLRPRWAPVAITYTLLMTPALVYLGEHYVVDALAGWAVALAAFVLVWVLELLAVRVYPVLAPLAARVRPPGLLHRPWVRWPKLPAWWGATRGALYPGLPLAVALLLMAGPLGYRPSRRLALPPPPPPCTLEPSTELDAVAGSARDRLGPVVVFAAEMQGTTCHWADPDRVLLDPEAARPTRLAALHRLLTDPDILWDPVVPEGATTIRRTVDEVEGEPLDQSYAVLLLVLEPPEPDFSSEQAEPIIEEAVEAMRHTAGR